MVGKDQVFSFFIFLETSKVPSTEKALNQYLSNE